MRRAIGLASGLLLCVMLLTGCAVTVTGESPAPSVPAKSPPAEASQTPEALSSAAASPSQPAGPSQTPPPVPIARQLFFDKGYDVRFRYEHASETDTYGFEWPYVDLTVAVTKDGRTIFQVGPKRLLGGVIGPEDGVGFDEERLYASYDPPENTVAGTQVYYAGGGDDVFVSYDPSDNSAAVWHREFSEPGPDINIADLFGAWQYIAGTVLDDGAEVILDWAPGI